MQFRVKICFVFILVAMLVFPSGIGNAKELPLIRDNLSRTQMNNENAVPGEYIVKFKKGVSKSKKELLISEHSCVEKKSLDIINAKLVTLAAMDDQSQDTLLEQLRNDPAIEYVQPNYYYYPADDTPISDDELASLLWGLKNYGQYVYDRYGVPGIDINLEPAWQVTKGDPTVVVAVIDTGNDISHPDLSGNIYINPGEIAGNGIDDDSNGKTDDVSGWDFYNNDNTVYHSANEDDHGTHCAGTIAAIENTGGVVGVAPLVKILPLKFIGNDPETGESGGSSADAIEAIAYAEQMGVEICSCSWGGSGYDTALYQTIATSEMLFIFAAGNDSIDNDADTPAYPASFTLNNIISVAAIDSQGNLADFSNYGATSVDVAAPGVLIGSTYPDSSYVYMDGTSMATPHVAGIAALIYSTGITDLTEIKTRIMNSARHHKLSSLTGYCITGGLVDAEYCVSLPPVASNVDIIGSPSLNQTLTGTYSYSDYEGDSEGTSLFQWYRSDSGSLNDISAIDGATVINYIVTSADIDKYLYFNVTPVAASGHLVGDAVFSDSVCPSGGSSVIYGDVNGDASISVTDAVLVLKYITNPSTVLDLNAADVSDDGSTTITDAVMILKRITNPAFPFPAES